VTVEEQLTELRERWKVATPENRKVIEMRAKLLKMKAKGPQPLSESEITEIFK
jgi:acetolactate synthase small subunit